MSNEIVKKERLEVFADSGSFNIALKMASVLSQSNIVPTSFQGNQGNCLIAIEIANSMNISPIFAMQNLHVIHGRPSWSSQFVISAINKCGRFSRLRFKFNENKTSCYAYANDLEFNEEVRGTTISIEMAKAEKWYDKTGSKWKTMPEQMLMYRAGAFFGRVHCPDILNGMSTIEESSDIGEHTEVEDLTPDLKEATQGSEVVNLEDSEDIQDAVIIEEKEGEKETPDKKIECSF